jgi:small conductance mechanosensitive channel
MDLQHQLQQARDWAFDLSQWPQKIMWAALILLGGYILGLVAARLLQFAARRIGGLTQRRGKAADAEAPKTADHVMVDILASVIRGLLFIGALAVAADVLGFYDVKQAQSFAVATLKGLIILVVVWFLGSFLAKRVRSFGEKVGKRTAAANETLFAFLASLVRFGALAIGLIAALQQFGFPIASLVAVIGAAGLAIALALQDTLKAVAAGVIIAVFRPYRIGDNVRVAGEEGAVADITPFTTVLNTIDNREIVITNDKAWGDVIVNSSARSLRRIDLLFSIDYDDDIDKAIEIIKETYSADPRVRKDPPVWAKVVELADSSVNLRGRAWCAEADWWNLRCDLLKEVKQAFDRNGITIPYPHQTQVDKYPARREDEDEPPAPEATPRKPPEARRRAEAPETD